LDPSCIALQLVTAIGVRMDVCVIVGVVGLPLDSTLHRANCLRELELLRLRHVGRLVRDLSLQ
jgi:hypothetical protein